MTEKILPLPVKKNKFGQRVADISVDDYYRQIAEEVLEAYGAANNSNITKLMTNKGCGQCAEFVECNEAEELVDIITCCVTRLKIIYEYKDDDFNNYISTLIKDAQKYYREPADFYTDLATAVMYSYHAADVAKMCDYMQNNGCGYCASDFERDYLHEKYILCEIIVLLIKRLEYLGYDEDARQKLYQAVNDKNKNRGYFDD